MPSNLYGVANAPTLAILIPTANVACPAGVATTVGTITGIIAPSQGFFYPACWWLTDVTYGASVPGSVQFGFRIGTGSYLDASQLNPLTFVAGATSDATFCMFGPASSVPWQAPGATVNFTITPTAQAVQANGVAGRIWFALFRAPDQ